MNPLFVRQLTSEEKQTLRQGLHSNSAFTLRRCQMLLSSADGLKPGEIAAQLHCSDETVRATIHAFHQDGLACLEQKSSRPHSATFSFSDEALTRLPDVVATSPRAYGLDHSLWSLERLARVCHQQGLTDRLVSPETMREALRRADINWQRARKRMQSTDPDYAGKKNGGIG